LFGESPVHPTTFNSTALYAEIKSITSNNVGSFINMVRAIGYLIKLAPHQLRDKLNYQNRVRWYASIRSYTRDDFFHLLDVHFSEEEKTTIYTAALTCNL
jgi:hypothetical protein